MLPVVYPYRPACVAFGGALDTAIGPATRSSANLPHQADARIDQDSANAGVAVPFG